MRQADVKIGSHYSMIVSGRVVRVTVRHVWDGTTRTGKAQRRYSVLNNATGRVLENLTAKRFRARWRPEFHGRTDIAERAGDMLEIDFQRRERDAERQRVAERDAERIARRASAVAGKLTEEAYCPTCDWRAVPGEPNACPRCPENDAPAGEWFASGCAACGGAVETMGALGNTAHGRCRGCGAEQREQIAG